MSVDKPRRLGRGLEALIATVAPPAASAERGVSHRLPIAQIRANPYQPRKEFRAEELAELRASLKANGLLQPIVVRPSAAGGYELIAGERRLRAATELGWTDIPVIVRDIDDRTLLTLALVENLQRADLNAVSQLHIAFENAVHVDAHVAAAGPGRDRSDQRPGTGRCHPLRQIGGYAAPVRCGRRRTDRVTGRPRAKTFLPWETG